MKRWQLATARIGRKSTKRRSQSMLLDREEIPGENWALWRQRSWRPGMFDYSPSRHAFQAGTFVSMRTFVEAEISARTFEERAQVRRVMVQVIPTASVADAETMMPDLGRRLEGESDSRTLGFRTIHNQEVAGVPNAWTFEKEYRAMKGTAITRYVAGHVGRVIFVVAGQGYVDPWTWAELTSLGVLQKEKVERTLATFEAGG
jgi:hypothetical protein